MEPAEGRCGPAQYHCSVPLLSDTAQFNVTMTLSGQDAGADDECTVKTAARDCKDLISVGDNCKDYDCKPNELGFLKCTDKRTPPRACCSPRPCHDLAAQLEQHHSAVGGVAVVWTMCLARRCQGVSEPRTHTANTTALER